MSCPQRRVEAMKKPSTAGGGKPSKARLRKPSRLKRHIVPKAVPHRKAATDRIAEWLDKLDLGHDAQRFGENDISFSVLPDLTDQDLNDIGSVIDASCCVRSGPPTASRKW
jgi:SAM domain (Sterile alpha motif)